MFFSHAIQVLFHRPPMAKRLSFRTKQYPGVDCPNHSNQPWAWVNMIVSEPVVNISRNSILFPMGQTGIIKVGVIKLNQAIKRRT